MRNLHSCHIQASSEKLHLDEIARIMLPMDWAMCKAPWYGVLWAVHQHGYPHAMHRFCGHRMSWAKTLGHYHLFLRGVCCR